MQGIVQVMTGTLLRWHSPSLQERVQKAVDTVLAAKGQKERTESDLVRSLTSTATITASSELTSFMDHIKELNDVCSVWVAVFIDSLNADFC